LPYRVVTKRIGGCRPGIEARGRENEIADRFFPELPAVDWSEEPIPTACLDANVPSEFVIEELREAVTRLRSGKATGPDGVPNDVLQRVTLSRPQLLLDVFNICLRTGDFPIRWKTAKLVLLHKGVNKPVADPSSYRPLCMPEK